MPAASRPPLRLFLALWPDEATRQAIATWQRAWSWPGSARLVPAERLHVTLHFIGNVAAARLPELATGLRVPFEPAELALCEGKVWPGGIAVLRPHATPAPLLRLHAELAQRLQSLQLPVEERGWRAHVTLARKADGASPPPAQLLVRWQANAGYVLVRSLANGGGYEVLERFRP